jgi:hypothetical protein
VLTLSGGFFFLYLASMVLQSMKSVDIFGGFFFSLPGLHGLAVDENSMTGPAQHAHKLIHDPTGHPCTIWVYHNFNKAGNDLK